MNYFHDSNPRQTKVQWFSSFYPDSINTLPKIYDFRGSCSDFEGMAVPATWQWVAAADLPEGVAVHAAWPLWQLVYLKAWQCLQRCSGWQQLIYPRAWQCMQHGSCGSWSTWEHGSACSAAAALPEGVAVRAAQKLVYLMARQLVYLRAWQCVQHSSWST